MDEYIKENEELLSYFISRNLDKIILLVKPGDENNLKLLSKYFKKDYPINKSSDEPNIFIRVKDLKIFPLKDLQKNLFCAGQFIIKNNQIIGIQPHNVTMLIVLNSVRRNKYPLCCICQSYGKCNGDNLIHMYNASGEIFMPRVKEFCKQYIGEYNAEITKCYK